MHCIDDTDAGYLGFGCAMTEGPRLEILKSPLDRYIATGILSHHISTMLDKT